MSGGFNTTQNGVKLMIIDGDVSETQKVKDMSRWLTVKSIGRAQFITLVS